MTTVRNPELGLSLAYAAAETRPALDALWQYDATLADILRATTDPMVGQLRLTWWHEAICALDKAPPPAQPVLQGLATHVLPRGVTGARLAALIDGWEVLLDAELPPAELALLYAARRGSVLFGTATAILGGHAEEERIAQAGKLWALVDLARHVADTALVSEALAQAATLRAGVFDRPWPRALRSVGALAVLAQRDARRGADRLEPVGAPSRIARMFWHRITGR